MRGARHSVCVLLAIALAWPASAADLTADEVVDRMVAANSAWLKTEFSSLSYVLRKYHIPPMAYTVHYRAPRHLRIDAEPTKPPPAPGGGEPRARVRMWPEPGKQVLVLPDGRGFAAAWDVRELERDASGAHDSAVSGIVFCGAAWALANRRQECRVSGLRREQADSRDCYHVEVSGYTRPTLAFAYPLPSEYHGEERELWIDAETFRPVREAWYDRLTSPSSYKAVRYRDYQPLPEGGEAPMRLGQWSSSRRRDAFTREYPPGKETFISRYQIVDGKLWLLHSVSRRNGEVTEEVADVSVETVPATAFYDEPLLRRLQRAAALYKDVQGHWDGQRWQELYDTCEEIVSLGWGTWRAARTLFPLYFWHGDYQKAIDLIKIVGDKGIYLAWAYDGAGQRAKALEKYRQIANIPALDSARQTAVEQGLKRPWVPPAKRLKAGKNERLLKPAANWRVKTFVPGLTPEAAVDGDRRTRWVSIAAQHPRMWFQVDLIAPTKLSRIAVDFVGDLTGYDRDYPREYKVDVSLDGQRWKTLAEGPGPLDNLVNVAFKPRTVRYVRIHQTGSTYQNCWSIHEMFFYAPKLGK